MSASFILAGLYALNVLAGFLTLILLLRFYMQAIRMPFAHPLGAFVLSLSNWLVLPLRRGVPAFFGFDCASLFAALGVQILREIIVFAVTAGLASLLASESWLAILLHGAAAVVRLALYALIFALILQAALSWLNPFSPIAPWLSALTRPFLAPIRRFVPLVAGIDLSPFLAILLAQIVLIFL